MKPLWEHSPFPLWVGVITIKWTNDDKGLQSFFWSLSHSRKKVFLDEIFCNMLLKIHIISSIHHIFWINFWWITKNFLKVYKFYQILHFILKNYPNFKLYEHILIILWFFSCTIKYNFTLDVMYITPHLHVVKDFWNIKFLFNRFLIFKILKSHKFQIVSVFWVWVIN
jgi:hypothetical protein